MKPSTIVNLWSRLGKFRAGRYLFSRLIGLAVPYSGTIDALVVKLNPGDVEVRMKDKRKVRNHLRSIHAIALVNLAELASGLAMLSGIPENARGIVKGFNISFHKKARGAITAVSNFPPPPDNAEKEYRVRVVLMDGSGESVAEAEALWLIGPIPE